MEKKLKYRMYFFVPYNISEIQKAIQAGHAALEYAYKYGDTEEYKSFIKNDKTWIILNGGTTRSISEDPGTMQELLNEIFVFNEQAPDAINHSLFKEPDLNHAMTAICFLTDERVWDYETYPDFLNYILNIIDVRNNYSRCPSAIAEMKIKKIENLQIEYTEYYNEWLKFMGGEKNIFLRGLLRGKKLA